MPHTITRLLNEWNQGNQKAFDQLIELVYDHICILSRRELKKEKNRNSKGLDTRDIAHTAFLSLAEKNGIVWQNRRHFFNVVAQSMRRVLILEARKRNTEKRGNGLEKVELDENNKIFDPAKHEELLRFDRLLEDLNHYDSVMNQVVLLRYYCGFNVEETAEILGISPATAKRKFRYARAWLRNQMRKDPE